MGVQVFISFILIMLTISLLLFNVPYWQGKKIYNMFKNGIWKFIFMNLSELGYALYKLLETICHKITVVLVCKLKGRIREKIGGFLLIIINLCIYCASIYFLTQAYEMISNIIVCGNSDIETISDITFYSEKQSVFAYFYNACSFIKVFIIGGRNGDKFIHILCRIFGLIAWNVLFYGILYGLLVAKLKEIDLSKYIRLATQQVSSDGSKSLIENIVDSINNFLKEKTIMSNIYINNRINKLAVFGFSIIVFLLSLTLYMNHISIIKPREFLITLINELKVVDIFASFLITFAIVKLSGKTTAVIVEKLPQPMQEGINSISESALEQVEQREQVRHRWEEKNDNVINSYKNGYYDSSKTTSENRAMGQEEGEILQTRYKTSSDIQHDKDIDDDEIENINHLGLKRALCLVSLRRSIYAELRLLTIGKIEEVFYGDGTHTNKIYQLNSYVKKLIDTNQLNNRDNKIAINLFKIINSEIKFLYYKEEPTNCIEKIFENIPDCRLAYNKMKEKICLDDSCGEYIILGIFIIPYLFEIFRYNKDKGKEVVGRFIDSFNLAGDTTQKNIFKLGVIESLNSLGPEDSVMLNDYISFCTSIIYYNNITEKIFVEYEKNYRKFKEEINDEVHWRNNLN